MERNAASLQRAAVIQSDVVQCKSTCVRGVCTCVRARVRVQVCVASVCVCVCACMHVCVCEGVHACVCVYACVFVRLCMRVFTVSYSVNEFTPIFHVYMFNKYKRTRYAYS